MELSRRSFLSAVAAAAPLGRAFGGPTFRPPALGVGCALPESRAGFAKAVAGQDGRDILILPGASGWDPSIVAETRGGGLVIFETGCAFTKAEAIEEQRAGLRGAFDLEIESPVELWTEGRRPRYLHLEWPVHAHVRDFSFVVPVRGGVTVGRIGGLPVAALQRLGAGRLLFLGSPLGPALWSGDPQAHTWLRSVFVALPALTCSDPSPNILSRTA